MDQNCGNEQKPLTKSSKFSSTCASSDKSLTSVDVKTDDVKTADGKNDVGRDQKESTGP